MSSKTNQENAPELAEQELDSVQGGLSIYRPDLLDPAKLPRWPLPLPRPRPPIRPRPRPLPDPPPVFKPIIR